MEISPHPVATEHLPSFITAPGQTDVLMVIMVGVLALSTMGFGILFFRLHSLPEQIAHKSQRLQAEVVAVLCLISLFTHMHIFWIIGLMLALIELPDFGTPLNRIAGSAEKLAGLEPGAGAVALLPPASAHAGESVGVPAASLRAEVAPGDGGGAAALPTARPEPAAKDRERIHA